MLQFVLNLEHVLGRWPIQHHVIDILLNMSIGLRGQIIGQASFFLHYPKLHMAG